jgi:hypothetical protein
MISVISYFSFKDLTEAELKNIDEEQIATEKDKKPESENPSAGLTAAAAVSVEGQSPNTLTESAYSRPSSGRDEIVTKKPIIKEEIDDGREKADASVRKTMVIENRHSI